MCEHGCRTSHTEGNDGPNIRPKQLRNREVSWEGSHRSKLMSRRTERPYKVDGMDELAPHSAVRCSIPEINGPVVQQEFMSLLRETCNPGLSATTGLSVSNGAQAGAGVSRGHSTGSNEPDNNTGRTHNSGRAELGRQTRLSMVLSRSDEAESAELRAANHRGRERVLRHSARTARNRRTRTRMYGGVGGGRGNSPADPIGPALRR